MERKRKMKITIDIDESNGLERKLLLWRKSLSFQKLKF